MKNLLIW